LVNGDGSELVSSLLGTNLDLSPFVFTILDLSPFVFTNSDLSPFEFFELQASFYIGNHIHWLNSGLETFDDVTFSVNQEFCEIPSDRIAC